MQPNRKQNYDIDPNIRPRFGVIQGGNESTPERAQLKEADSVNDVRDRERNFDVIDGGGESTPDRANLQEAGLNDNIDNTKEREENAGGWQDNVSGNQPSSDKSSISLKSRLMKKGPLGGIILLLVAGGIGISGLLSPALLLVQMKNIFQNDLNDAGTALSVRTQVMLTKKIGNTKNGFSESSDGKCGIKCKFGTVSDTLVRNLDTKGFKVETEQKFGRHVIKSMTFPDGHTVSNGKDFQAAMKDPARAASFNRVFNSKIAFFLNSKFGSILKTKFGLDKAFKLVGDTKDKFKASLRKSIGLPEATVADPSKPAPTAEESAKTGPFKGVMEKIGGLAGGKSAAGVGAACLGYNSSRAITVGVKAAKLSAYAAYAMTFLNAADKIVAGDNIDPNIVSYLGEQLTSTDPNKTNADGTPNPMYGLDATSSTGYKASAYGDASPLPAYAQNDTISTAGIAGTMAALTTMVASDPTSRNIGHTLCSTINNPGAIVAMCAPYIAAAGVGFLACLGTQAAVGFAISGVIGAVLPKVISAAVDANTHLPDENTKGVGAGNAMRIGSAAIFGGAAASYGLKAGSKSDIKKYLAYTSDIKKQDEAIARYEAKQAPFDIYNQYSFLGSLAQNLNIASYAGTSVRSGVADLASVIPRSLTSVITNSYADTTMSQSANKADQYGLCEDPALKAINVDGDANCNPSYVMSEEELSANNDTVTDWMINNGNIDANTGAAMPGSDYKLYLDNCANRTEPLGETSKGIEEGNPGDYEWFIGANCQEQSERLTNFHVYKADISVNSTLDHEEEPDTPAADTTSSSADSAASGPVNPNGWTFPTTAGAALRSPFGPRDGAFHTGVDLDVASGSPFYATRDGVIQNREFNIYSIPGPDGVGGSWCPVTPSESPNQKDIWMTHTVDGVTYTSVYAHLSRFTKKSGDTVKAGELIGYTGGSGCSSGPHVHFEIWKGPATPGVVGPGMLDPWPLINK